MRINWEKQQWKTRRETWTISLLCCSGITAWETTDKYLQSSFLNSQRWCTKRLWVSSAVWFVVACLEYQVSWDAATTCYLFTGQKHVQPGDEADQNAMGLTPWNSPKARMGGRWWSNSQTPCPWRWVGCSFPGGLSLHCSQWKLCLSMCPVFAFFFFQCFSTSWGPPSSSPSLPCWTFLLGRQFWRTLLRQTFSCRSLWITSLLAQPACCHGYCTEGTSSRLWTQNTFLLNPKSTSLHLRVCSPKYWFQIISQKLARRPFNITQTLLLQ